MALNPEAGDGFRATVYRKISAAYARGGQVARARQALAEADRLFPFDTVRGHSPEGPNPVYAAQMRDYQEGLRRAGERDHADEEADFGVQADAILRSNPAGYTPATTPGAQTIRTAELPRFIAEREPVIIDPLMYFWGRSIPGAVWGRHIPVHRHRGVDPAVGGRRGVDAGRSGITRRRAARSH